ncbi:MULTISPECIES: ion transporter [Kordiimonas]|jgi:voltage-gated potassium channel|uniref:ion transporter n=1 Tax=Kordiimonas TaxID=288021 RepID=UPI00257F3F23|nr:ion transporter [Kordiimonas sp. UBA4487]
MTTQTARQRTYNFLEMGSFAGRKAAVFEGFMIALILLNVLAVVLETVDSLWQAYSPWFRAFDAISIGIFTVEYLARVWASAEREAVPGDTVLGRRIRYIFSPLALIDLIAIIPFYLGQMTGLDLRALRIFRLLRLLKLVRYSPALSSLARVIYAERQALLAAMVIMVGLEVFASTLMYLVEREAQPEVFGSIPAALWWALATFTTVGYGDAVPVTDLGKVIGGVVMIMGFIFYAVPIGIIASGFTDEVHRREFVVPVGVVDDLPALRKLPKDIAKELASRVRSVTMVPGTVLTRRSDRDNGIYFILSGEITVFYHHRAIPLNAGDFLGECSLISDRGAQPASVARSRCRVMWLDSTELQILMSIYPPLLDELREFATRRLIDLVEDGLLSSEERATMIAHYDHWVGLARSPQV